MKNFNKQIAHRESFWQCCNSRELIDSLFQLYSLPVFAVASVLLTQKTPIDVSVTPPITNH
jgi:hypothetical protein